MCACSALAIGVKLKVARSCPTLCDPMDCRVHGIPQARILEWVAFPSPGGLPNPGIKPRSSALQVDLLPAEPQGKARNNGVGIGENGGQMECSFTTGGNLKVSPLWKKSHFLIKLNMYLPCDSIISLLSIYIRKTKPYDDKKICT